MRIAVALAIVAAGTGSQAMAADPALPFADIVATTTQAALTTVPLVEARFGANIASQFQSHATIVADQFTSEGTALRHRFASSMMEFYPLANSGFHFSGGIRFFGVTNFTRDADKLTNNLLWSPGNRGSGGIRYGFKRQTPAMTFGYTKTVANRVAFGLEGGTILGRVNASMPHSFERRLGGGRDANRMNPVANLVFGLKF